MSKLCQTLHDTGVGDSVLVRKVTATYEAEPLQVQCRAGTRVVAKRQDGSSITRTTAHFKDSSLRID